jgi:hypothetical protein
MSILLMARDGGFGHQYNLQVLCRAPTFRVTTPKPFQEKS